MKKILLFLLLISSVASAQTRVGVASGTNNTYEVTFNPPLTSFNTYAIYLITFTNGNTGGAVTLDPAGPVAATSIKDNAGNTLVAGAIRSNATYSLRFDGTNLRMIEWVNPPTKNITWIIKSANYTPVPADTLLAQVGFLMRSVNALSFTIPPSAAVDFNEGTSFRVKADSTGGVSILEGAGVSFKCVNAGPWTLDDGEYATITKINSSNTWELILFKRINISEESPVAVFTEYSTVGNVTGGEDVLFSDTLAANTLATNGNLVSGRFSGIVANNANVKTIRLSFGGTDIVTRNTTTPTIGQGWVLDWQCIRVDAGNQKCNGTFTGSDGIASAYYVATTADLTEDVIIQLTGESAAAASNDIVKHTASGNFAPGAGSGTTPPPIVPPDIPFVIVDNAVRGSQGYQWNYVSTWATPGTGIEGWYDETLDYTGTTNATAEITFNGTRIQLYTEKLNTHGIFEISLDGTVVDTVDLYSATQQLQALVFDTGDADDPDNEEDLTQDVHTLTLRCTGTKNASSSNFYMLVDYVKIENPQTVPDEEIPVPPATATHFVKKTGSDGGGNNCETEGTPCLTITYALTQTTSGDVLSIGPGTYTETGYLTVTTGESIIGAGVDATIVKVVDGLQWNVDCSGVNVTKAIFQLTGAGSTAQTISDLTIDGSNKIMHGGLAIGVSNARNNVTVEDVKFTNFDYFGAYVHGNGHTFRNVQLINSAEAAACFSTGNLLIGGTEDFMCDNVDINDNSGGYGVKSWGGNVIIDGMTWTNGSDIRILASSPYGGGGIPNIAFEFAECRPRNCVISNSYFDNCISLVRVNGATNDGIPSVHITNNTLDMITKGGGNSINTPIELSYHNVEIDNNHFVGGRYAYIVSWNVNETAPAINWDIHHNTFYCVGHVNSPTGILRSSYAGFQDIDFFNNTIHIPPSNNFYTTLFYTGCCGFARSSTDIDAANNVIYDQSTSDGGVGGASQLTRLEGSGGGWTSCVFRNNTVNGMSTTLPGGWTVSNTLTTSPAFIGGGGANPSPFVYDPFYRPAAGSPLLNSGVDVGFGATPDRGRIQD